MQIDFFEIENTDEPQKMLLPWPMKFCAFNIRGGMVRIYYVPLPGATEQKGTFFCIKTNQVLPETFPAQMVGSVFPHGSQSLEADEDDNAVHVFFQTPVNNPTKPRPVGKKRSRNAS